MFLSCLTFTLIVTNKHLALAWKQKETKLPNTSQQSDHLYEMFFKQDIRYKKGLATRKLLLQPICLTQSWSTSVQTFLNVNSNNFRKSVWEAISQSICIFQTFISDWISIRTNCFASGDFDYQVLVQNMTVNQKMTVNQRMTVAQEMAVNKKMTVN